MNTILLVSMAFALQSQSVPATPLQVTMPQQIAAQMQAQQAFYALQCYLAAQASRGGIHIGPKP